MASICNNTVNINTDCQVVCMHKLEMEYCKKYCNTDLEKSIAFSIVTLFPPIAIAILLASIANNPAVLTLLSYNNTVKIFATRSVFHG